MFLKPFFDRIVSLVGLLLLWPVLLVIAVLVRVKVGKPAFFVQERIGKDGKLFRIHKFRTMEEGFSESPVSIAGEERITPFGAKLRHYKLDELPELWDVLIGNMSFVGPPARRRPRRAEAEAWHHRSRHIEIPRRRRDDRRIRRPTTESRRHPRPASHSGGV